MPVRLRRLKVITNMSFGRSRRLTRWLSAWLLSSANKLFIKAWTWNVIGFLAAHYFCKPNISSLTIWTTQWDRNRSRIDRCHSIFIKFQSPNARKIISCAPFHNDRVWVSNLAHRISLLLAFSAAWLQRKKGLNRCSCEFMNLAREMRFSAIRQSKRKTYLFQSRRLFFAAFERFTCNFHDSVESIFSLWKSTSGKQWISSYDSRTCS